MPKYVYRGPSGRLEDPTSGKVLERDGEAVDLTREEFERLNVGNRVLEQQERAAAPQTETKKEG